MKQKMISLWNKCVNPETVSYLICGVLTTIINYATDLSMVYVLNLAEIPLAATIANLIAWVVSVIFAFFANKIFVFKSSVWTGKEFMIELTAFVIARVASLGFETLFIFVTVDLTKLLPNWIAKILSNVFVVIMNYFASKLLIFRTPKEAENVNK